MVRTKAQLKRQNVGAVRRGTWRRAGIRQTTSRQTGARYLGYASSASRARRRFTGLRRQDVIDARGNYFRDANDTRDWNQRRAWALNKYGPKALLQPPWKDRLGNRDMDAWKAGAEESHQFLLWQGADNSDN